jgi:hypothetical protein
MVRAATWYRDHLGMRVVLLSEALHTVLAGTPGPGAAVGSEGRCAAAGSDEGGDGGGDALLDELLMCDSRELEPSANAAGAAAAAPPNEAGIILEEASNSPTRQPGE